MARISRIYYRRSLIMPIGLGFKTRGVFFGTLGGAIDYIKALTIAGMLLAFTATSCSKPPADGIVLTVKASNVTVIDHREIRLFFSFTSQGIEYTPADSTLVQVIYKQRQYKLNLPANEASVYMLPGITVSDTAATSATIIAAYNSKVKINF